MARKFGKKNEIKIDPLAYNTCLIGESGIGKFEPLSTPLLLENGWIKMGDVKIGDKIYGQDGKLHNITGIYPQGVKDIYKITFSDGTINYCGLEHLWEVTTIKQRTENNRDSKDRFSIKTLEEIMVDYVNPRNNAHKYAIPVCKPIDYPTKQLPIDSYFLGLMLGDGSLSEHYDFVNAEKDILDYIRNTGWSMGEYEYENHMRLNISSDIKKIFKTLELDNCGSREKFIPKEYLTASIEDRINLLSGLINTDGSISKGVSIDFTTYSKQLQQDVLDLARGLGFMAIEHDYDRTTEQSTDKYEFEVEYRVRIIGDINRLNLSNKHKDKVKQRIAPATKLIVNIELDRQEEAQCIMVDNPRHLYITNQYVVTHNTTLAIDVCNKLVGEDGYICLNIGMEDGIDAIKGAIYENIPDWDTLEEIKDDIIENRNTDYKDLKVLIYDTWDELIKIAQAEVIRMHNRANPDKKTKSIKAAFGGYMAGEDKAIEIILELMWELKSIGISFFVIGHTKKRTLTDPTSDIEYDILTTNCSNRAFTALKTKLHFLGVASIDRHIVQEKIKQKGTNKTRDKGTISEEIRKVTFRDDSYSIDSKSRFANIVPQIPLDSDAFIKALNDAILAEAGVTKKEAKEIDTKQKKEKEDKINDVVKEKNRKSNEELVKEIKELFPFISEEQKKILLPLMSENNITSFDNPDSLDSDVLLKLLEIIKK